MTKRTLQSGNMALIAIIAGLVVVVLAAAGGYVYWKMQSPSSTGGGNYSNLPTAPTHTASQAETTKTATQSNSDSPQVKVDTSKDLETVQNQLNNTNLDVGSSVNY